MAQLSPYLTFRGDCRQAMNFYQSCLGGQLDLQRIADSPMADHLPASMQEYILHASLTTREMVIMGSDMAPEALLRGNANSIFLSFSSEKEARSTYACLARGSCASNALELTDWGALFGDLTDRYGNQWLFSVKAEAALGGNDFESFRILL